MKKLLIILTLFIATNAQAYDYQAQAKKALAAQNMDVSNISKAEMMAILSQFQTIVKQKGYDKISGPEKEALKQAYNHLKFQRINDPEMKRIMNKAISIIEESKMLK
tara:strand:+ start:812 stop:1132 length:321 start_codon:yes stop_codon:yes gene_type:complete